MDSLKDSGTVTIRPSNSGMATFMAVSSGFRPRLDSAHAPRAMPLATAWITGTPSRSSAVTFPPGSVTPPAFTSPSANDSVLTSASTRPSIGASASGKPSSCALRLDVNTASAFTPAASSASSSASTKAVLPLSRCAR